MKIAIIGAGVSGLLAARLLADDHDIHVFEANDYAGGHTNTVAFEAFGQHYAVDTGFMVFNDRTYRRSADFIQRYIFPGGCLPSIGAICRSLARVTDFRLFHLEDITPHYAETLAQWRQRFGANLEQMGKLGFPEDFLRTWEFYFCYCEGGFRERVIGDVQILLTKPACRRAAIVPPPNGS